MISIGGFVVIIEEDKYDFSFPARATAQVMYFFTLTSRLLFFGWVQLNNTKLSRGKLLSNALFCASEGCTVGI